MNLLKGSASLFLMGILLLSLPGCGEDSQGRKDVTGSITLDGTPVTDGTIQFEPCGKQAERTRSGAPIVDGKYSIDLGKGLAPGEYLVRISSKKDTGKTTTTGMGQEAIYKEMIPQEFNTNSDKKITVKEGAKNVFDFNIKSSK
ncbi:MAG: hypothetical protein PHE53_06290 [Thermoguttaceae bacterium]|nr:hypothetical protein [Thermoguttaceae bacterium]